MNLVFRTVILTVSDRASTGGYQDLSGPALVAALPNQFVIVATRVIPDQPEAIRAALLEFADGGQADLILTTGGTGFSDRDVTPEATRTVIERPTAGLDETMRAASRASTPYAILSRATSGIRGRSLIVNLPGSPKGAVECLQALLPALPHGLELLRGPVADRQHQA
jgi:molybdenum cofactor synthesis domain-containing protein